MTHATREAGRMALVELWHDRRMTLVLALTVASILAPLLLLLGLKNGVVTQMREHLLQDPRNLEIKIYADTRLTRAWFERYGARGDIAFIVPTMLHLDTVVDLVTDARRIEQNIALKSSGPGDPLLAGVSRVPIEPQEVVVTAALADRLELDAHMSLSALVDAIDADGTRHHARVPLDVVGVLAESDYSGSDVVFATIDLIAAIDDFKDGDRAALADGRVAAGYASRKEVFWNARIYASGLDEVASLAAAMRAEGLEIRTRAEDIEAVQALDAVLTFVFRVLLGFGGTGCVLALGGALWVNVERKRRSLALLRLLGFGNRAVALIPVTQGLAIAAFGLVIAACAYWGGAALFDRALAGASMLGGSACRIPADDWALGCAAVLGAALLASFAAAVRASRVTSAEGVRASD